MLDTWTNAVYKWHSWPQWFASFDVFLISLVVGLETGWASPYLAKLTSADSALPVTEYEASWLASLLNMGRIFGSIGGLICAEYLGSKACLVYNAFIHGISSICLLYINSLNWLYASRFIAGFASGMWIVVFPIYTGEISHKKIRGALVSFITLGMPMGFILGNAVGAQTSMWIFGIFSLIPVVVFELLFFWLPHTPHYLVLNDQIDQAVQSIKWYQRDADIDFELIAIKDFVEKKRWLKTKDYFQEIHDKVNRIIFIKIATIYMFLQFAGFCTIAYYLEIIIRASGLEFMKPADAVPTISAMALVGGIIAIYTCDKFGRKMSLGCCSIVMGLSLLIIGVYFHLLNDFNSQVLTYQWVPSAMFIIFEFAINLGIDPVIGTIFSEMFSATIKTFASCLINVLSSLFAFVATRWYQSLVDTIEIHYVFYFYGINGILMALFTFFFLPETKGKSLLEIQAMLRKQ